MREEVATATTITFLKNIAYIPAILLGLSFDSYFILVAFMTVDIILGITRTAVIYGGRHIKSYRFTIGIISKLTMLIVPLLVVWAGKGVGVNLVFLAQWTLGALVLAEAYSILGNIHAIHIRKDVPEFDVVSWILKKIQTSLIRILQTEREDDNFVPAYKDDDKYEKKD